MEQGCLIRILSVLDNGSTKGKIVTIPADYQFYVRIFFNFIKNLFPFLNIKTKQNKIEIKMKITKINEHNSKQNLTQSPATASKNLL